MNQSFLVVVALAITVTIVAGAPVTPQTCSKLKDVDHNNRYLVLLKNNHTVEDANQIIKVVDDYQSSLETSGSGFIKNCQSIISKLTYDTHVKQLRGYLSEEALLLVCKDESVKLIEPDRALFTPSPTEKTGEYGKCDLPQDYNDEYHEIVFVYNITSNLSAIKEEVESLDGVLSAEMLKDSNSSIVFHMNREAYENACTHQEVLSVRYYSDAPPRPAPITCNKLQNFEADNDRYLIVLKECHTAQDVERLIKIVNKYQSSLTYLPDVGQLQGTLSNEALSQVCNDVTVMSIEPDPELSTIGRIIF